MISIDTKKKEVLGQLTRNQPVLSKGNNYLSNQYLLINFDINFNEKNTTTTTTNFHLGNFL